MAALNDHSYSCWYSASDAPVQGLPLRRAQGAHHHVVHDHDGLAPTTVHDNHREPVTSLVEADGLRSWVVVVLDGNDGHQPVASSISSSGVGDDGGTSIWNTRPVGRERQGT
jgi:hypothetical protein